MADNYSYRKQFDKYRTTSSSLISLGKQNALNNKTIGSIRTVTSLNGNWNFTVDPYETCLRNDWFKEQHFDYAGKELPVDFDFDNGERVIVPSCWNMEKPEYFYYENLGIYTRNFNYEKKSNEERSFLHFEGASYRAYVFLNGEPIALHDGASTPFSVEVTGKLKNTNRLIVAVDASRSPERVPTEYTDWFNFGGLYRDVSLITTPKTFIKDFFVYLIPDGNFNTIAADITIDGSDYSEVHLSIDELNIKQTVPIITNVPFESQTIHTVHVEFSAHPELWSPENPRLYSVTVSCGEDSLTDRIGFREFKVKGRNILLNGKEIFLKGMSVHEDHVTLGKCNTEKNIRSLMKDIKSLNGNYLRLAHYPHSRLVAKIADEVGILLWEEIPVYWSIDFTNQTTYADAENQLTELIMRDRNRASVIIWSVGNENLDTDERFSFMSRLAAKAHALDITRAVSAACLVNEHKHMLNDRLADCLDIIGMNEYYGWYDPVFENLLLTLSNSNPTKPVIISEFGADARAGFHSKEKKLWSEEYQAEIYKHQTETIAKCPYVKGITPWILYDFHAARRQNKQQQGFNRKGLIDSDRKTKKLAFKVLVDFYKTK